MSAHPFGTAARTCRICGGHGGAWVEPDLCAACVQLAPRSPAGPVRLYRWLATAAAVVAMAIVAVLIVLAHASAGVA